MTAALPWPALAGRRWQWKAGPELGKMEVEPSLEQFATDPAGRGQFAQAELVPKGFAIDPVGQVPANSALPTEDKVGRAASLLL